MFLDTLKGLVLCIRLQRLAPKKGGVFFDVAHAIPRTQMRIMTLRYFLLVAIGGVGWL